MKNNDCVWPSGDDKPVCMLRYTHQKFSEMTGLIFENGIDDFDEYFGSYVIDREIGPIKIMEYPNSPTSGVVLSVDSLVGTSYAVSIIKKKFNLLDSDVTWIRDAKLDAANCSGTSANTTSTETTATLESSFIKLRGLPNETVPKTGWWFSLAMGKQGRQRFNAGDKFPGTEFTNLGRVIWAFESE